MKTSYTIALIALGTGLALPCHAHHSTAVNFDRDSIISVEGVVADYKFQNPHVQVLLDVMSENGDVEIWMVELSAKSQLVRSGWTGNEFEKGQVITIFGWEGYRERSAYLRRAILPDGTELQPPQLLTERPRRPFRREQ